MKKESYGLFNIWDRILHISYAVVFILCIFFGVSYHYNKLGLDYGLFSSFALLIIAITRLSLDSIKSKEIIKDYERKFKK